MSSESKPEPESPPKAKPARDERGLFARGNCGGPGRPRGKGSRPIEDYRRITTEACTPQKWKRIVERAVSQAESGNHRAREFLARILLGSDPLALQPVMDELRTKLKEVEIYERRLRWTAAIEDTGRGTEIIEHSEPAPPEGEAEPTGSDLPDLRIVDTPVQNE
jgi:hypothetical protein